MNAQDLKGAAMTKREIASLAIKLMGVFILLKSISYVPMAYSGMFYAVREGNNAGILQTVLILMMSTAMAVVPLAFSILVIVLSDKAAAWLIKEDNSIENASTSISKTDVMAIVISCIGLYFIVNTTPRFIHALITIRRYPHTPFPNLLNVGRELIAPAVQIALGVWLFVGSKGIAKFWKKIRS